MGVASKIERWPYGPGRVAPRRRRNRSLGALFPPLVPACLLLLLWLVVACGEEAGPWRVDEPTATPVPGREWRVRSRPANRPPEGARRELVVAATSDLHGWITKATLFPDDPPAGLAYLAPLITELRGGNRDFILLDGGDALQGAPNLTFHQEPPRGGAPEPPPPVLRLMQRLGYGAMALGNHDLERGWPALNHWMSGTDFPWLSANLVDEEGSPVLAPYRIMDLGGLRVGVLGLTTPGAPAWVDEEHLAGLHLEDMSVAAERWLPIMREVERADLVIGLIHAGLSGWYDREVALRLGLPLPNAAGLLADVEGRLDLIISGHSHRRIPSSPEGSESAYLVPIVAPGARGDALAVVRLNLVGRAGRWMVEGLRREILSPSTEPDRELLAEVAGALARTRGKLAETTRVRFVNPPGKEEFYRCAGALSHQASELLAPRGNGADPPFSLLPMMWRFLPPTQQELGAPLSRAHLYRWIPYDNTLVLTRLTARQMALMLDPYARRRMGLRARYSAVLYPGGLEASIRPGGSEVIELSRRGPNGGVLPAHDYFQVWLTNYHWNGGGGLAPRALLRADQLLDNSRGSLRELLFRLLSSDSATLPVPCQGFLVK